MSDDAIPQQAGDLKRRLAEFNASLTSKADDELFEVLHAYNVAMVPGDKSEMNKDEREEALHKGLWTSLEIKRRYAEETNKKYCAWLKRHQKVDPYLAPEVVEAILSTP